MAELLTARDKLPQLEGQIRTAEMELFVLNIRMKFDPGPIPETANDFEKAAMAALKGEADASRAGAIVWERKLAVLRPLYEELKVEIARQGAEKEWLKE